MAELRLITLDFDDTFVLTNTSWHRQWEPVFAAHQVDLPIPRWNGMMQTDENPAWVLWRDHGVDIAQQAYFDHCKASLQRVREWGPEPGAVALLTDARAAGIATALVTNSCASWPTKVLPPEALAVFDHVFTREADDPPKPAPDLYRKALRHFEVRPSEALGVEDNEVGVQALRASGMTSIHVRSGAENLPIRNAAASVASLRDVNLEFCRAVHARTAEIGVGL